MTCRKAIASIAQGPPAIGMNGHNKCGAVFMEFTLRFIRIFFLELYYAAPVLILLVLLISFIGYLIGRIGRFLRAKSLPGLPIGFLGLRPILLLD